MSPKDPIRHTLGMADHLLQAYIGDLTNEEIFLQPVAGMNHIAWQMGHLISSEHDMAEKIKPGASPALPAGFGDVHGRSDTKGTSPSQFLSKEAYLELYKAQRAATNAILDSLTDAELASATSDNYAQIAPNFASLINLIGQHYLMHLGQFVAVRRAANKPIAI